MPPWGAILGTSDWEETLGTLTTHWRDYTSSMRLQDAPGRAGGHGWGKEESGLLCFSCHLKLNLKSGYHYIIGLMIYWTERRTEYIPAEVFMFYSVWPHVSFQRLLFSQHIFLFS